jgi:hypothetical protein
MHSPLKKAFKEVRAKTACSKLALSNFTVSFCAVVVCLFPLKPAAASIITATVTASIEKYEISHELCDNGKVFAHRHFFMDGEEKYLVINTRSLRTKVVDAATLSGCMTADGPPTNSLLARALRRYDHPTAALSAFEGFKKFSPHCKNSLKITNPLVFTADLCPSSKTAAQWNQSIRPFLESLAALTPVVLSASGVWLKTHPQELQAIKAMNLDITWANHSETHGILPGRHVSEEQAFLTQKSLAEFDDEVLKAEITMLERGLTPSILFRFPGLYSKAEQIEEMRTNLTLVPLNTTAWLALDESLPGFFKACGMNEDQRAEPGRVILTHANGNEPAGISRATRLVEKINSRESADGFIPALEAISCDLQN